MKIKINRNIFWTNTFVNELVSLGVKYACISPGSRNTPLTYAFAVNKKIKSFVHIDERSCGFFALGLAKASNTPVAVVTTSGTATAELYPAIIEAYQQRVALIICTADRPPELLDRGANQTINQNNLYKNHIRWFIDTGLPEPVLKKIKHIKAAAGKAIYESCIRSRGPVHLNFPFKKPFEPDSFTDEITKDLYDFSNQFLTNKKELFSRRNGTLKEEEKNILAEKWFCELAKYFKKFRKGLIIAGPENYNPDFHKNCQIFAEKLGYPILADGASQLRFGKHSKKNIISNFEGFLRDEKFSDKIEPEIIIQFGRTITSKALDQYLEKLSSPRYMINEFGDWFDPSNKTTAVFACKPYLFCEKILQLFKDEKFNHDMNWLKQFNNAEEISSKLKKTIIENSEFPNESRIISEIINTIPDESQIMISNSMPIRDFDYFATPTQKEISIYNNRGASGIDGIISTALGIAAANNKPTVLLTGDLAFYYDLNGLLAAVKYSIPIVIVLINNNGGGIFEVLPISKYGKVFKDFFITPHNLNFEPFVKGFGGNYELATNWQDLNTRLNQVFKKKIFTVIEIKTEAEKSLKLREKFWNSVSINLSKKKIKNVNSF